MNTSSKYKDMPARVKGLLFAVILSVFPFILTAATVTINPDGDTYVNVTNPDTNYGTSTNIAVNNTGINSNNGFMHFNSALIPGAYVNSAILYFYSVFSSGTPVLDVMECSAPWSETALTYNNMPGVSGTQVSVTITSATASWYSVTITAFANNWILGTNNGLRISSETTGGSCILDSKEASASFRPYLVVDYSPASPTPTRTATMRPPTSTFTVTLTPTSTFTVTQTPTAGSPDAYEADDTDSSAKPIAPGRQYHSIVPAADIDWITFTLTGLTHITVITSGPTASDTRMWLYDSAGVPGTPLLFDDNSGVGLYSQIDTVLDAGVYYVKIDENNNDGEIPEYYLDFTADAVTATLTWTVSMTFTATRTITQTRTASPTFTVTSTRTATPTRTVTRTATPYYSPTVSPTGTPLPTPDVNLADAVDNYSVPLSTSGSANWFRETSVSYYGGDAAQSGAIGSSQSTSMSMTVTGPGTLTFWWRVSSESYYDSLNFYDNSSYITNISGTGYDWTQRTFSITSGTHILRWTYSKDSSGISGSDCGWVDQIQYVGPGPTATPTVVPTVDPGLVNQSYVYPMPATDLVTFAFYLTSPADVKIYVYNQSGALAASVTGSYNSGLPGTLQLDTNLFSPGVYYYIIRAELLSGGTVRLKPGKFLIKR